MADRCFDVERFDLFCNPGCHMLLMGTQGKQMLVYTSSPKPVIYNPSSSLLFYV